MRSDKRPFLDNADLDIANLIPVPQSSFDQFVMNIDLLLEPKGRRQIRRPGPDKHHIHLDLFAFDHIVLKRPGRY